MRIALVSDAWQPQVNGVVRTLTTTVAELGRLGHEVETITPDGFRTVACPSYPEIRLALFRPDGPRLIEAEDLPGPVMLHVGRVAPEKNIEAFLAADLPGSKLVVGEGPALAGLRERYPAARFIGALHGERLAAAYRTADVLVFPSLTDTFGLVMAEAVASGTPVAAFPVPGPLDVVVPGAGVLDDDLATAVRGALTLDRGQVAALGQRFDWGGCTGQFLDGLTRIARVPVAA